MNASTAIWRGARKRCAVCGGGDLFDGWFGMRPHCPTCATRFEREPGFFGGALFVNFAITEVVMFGWLAVVLLITIPNPSIPWLLGGALAICVTLPIALYPSSKTIWFAIHVAMQPLDPDEEAEAAVVRIERGDLDT